MNGSSPPSSLSTSRKDDDDKEGRDSKRPRSEGINPESSHSTVPETIPLANLCKKIKSPPACINYYEFVTKDCKIEKGSFGITYKGRRISDGKAVVIKLFRSISNSYKEVFEASAAEHECNITEYIRRCNVDGVVEILDVISDKDSCTHIIVEEYLAGGDIFQNITNDRCRPEKKFNEKEAADIMFSVLQSVDNMHRTARVVHNDLKLENIMFSKIGNHEESNIKIIDFGLSLLFKEGEDIEKGKFVNLESKMGTLCYIAPEIRSAKWYSAKSDVWALGILLCVMLTGQYPFKKPYIDVQLLKPDIYDGLIQDPDFIPNFFTDTLARNISVDGKDFIAKLLKLNKDERMSMQEALQHRWIVNRSSLSQKPFGEVYNQKMKVTHINRRLQAFVYHLMFISRIRKLAIAKHNKLELTSFPPVTDACGSLVDINSGNSNNRCSSMASISNSSDSESYSSESLDDLNQINVFSSSQLLTLREAFKSRIEHDQIEAKKYINNNSSSSSSSSSNNSNSNSNSSAAHSNRSLSELIDSHGVNFESFREVCRSVGLDILAKEFVFNLFDKDHNGNVDYKEFLVSLTSFQEFSDVSLNFYFDLLKDNSGEHNRISINDFRLLLDVKVRSRSNSSSNLNCVSRSTSESVGGGSSIEREVSNSSLNSNCSNIDSNSMDLHRHITEEEGVSISDDGFVSFEEFKKWMGKNFDLIKDFLQPLSSNDMLDSTKTS